MLSILVLIPFAGALITAVMPARPKLWAFGFAIATLLVGLVTAFTAPDTNLMWMKPLGVHWALEMDGFGKLMVLLTVVLVPLVMVAAVKDHDKRWYAWALALEAFGLLTFLAADLFVFYIAFEATLIPAYFMIGQHGGPQRAKAALKFLMFQLGGGLVLLGALIGFFVVSSEAGTPSYLISDLAQLDIGTTAQRWIFVAMFIAFAVKAPLFPVHTWLADTTEQATPATSVLLVCILDKIGTFGMIRLCLGLVPEASAWATPVVVVLALISIVYGAVLAIGQDDLLRLIGLTSLSHFGLITLGIFVATREGLVGSILYMVNHGVATAAMFLIAGFLISRKGTASISAMRGLEKATPVLAGTFLVAGLATAGLPGLSQFVSEIMVLISAFDHHWLVGVIAVTAIVLAAIYVLWAYQRIFTGPAELSQGPVADLDRREIGVVAPLLVALLFFGFVPGPLISAASPVVEPLVNVRSASGGSESIGLTPPGTHSGGVAAAHDATPASIAAAPGQSTPRTASDSTPSPQTRSKAGE